MDASRAHSSAVGILLNGERKAQQSRRRGAAPRRWLDALWQSCSKWKGDGVGAGRWPAQQPLFSTIRGN
uniref:Uncharacterized protein n=1 Tax=Oryza sativa subsp. japonica TaxID=39947 RepID=Q69WY9_ORYSJ|nr:hypothetical protein [Oryza sativa Japonica Group]BAD35548.1 hypothetical protein [Oryza sativa Japonica Group]